MTPRPIAFLEANAPSDVTSVVGWMRLNGFEIASAEPGPSSYSAFGFYLDFASEHLVAPISVDRGVWEISLGYAGHERHPLEVLLLAESGGAAEVPDYSYYDPRPLPEQLPVGVSWSECVPRLDTWLRLGDRTAEIARALPSWEAANERAWARAERGSYAVPGFVRRLLGR